MSLLERFQTLFQEQENQTVQEPTATAEEALIRFGLTSVSVTPGKTLEETINEYQETLGIDPSRINRYVEEGKLVESSTIVEASKVYTITINAQEKG